MAASRSKDSKPAANSVSGGEESKRTKAGSEGPSGGDPVQPPQAPEGKETAQPLGPPPRPSQQSNGEGDYFNQVHSASNNSNNHPYQSEPNPFEAQFSNPASETPGKLPSVAALTSPSALLPGDTPGWNSLRSGPLSPAMLAGPAGNDYFDSSYSRSFPTPNESSLRTGLTPGGGGSMFPAPSPNSQAIFSSLHLGVNTPSTMEFLRTSQGAKAATNGIGPTSQPSENQNSNSMDVSLPTGSSAPSDPYAHPDADAANGLFMLAQSNGSRSGNQFAVPQISTSMSSNANQMNNSNGNGRQQPSRGQREPPANPASSGSTSSEDEQPAKPATRSRGKKASETKTPNNRRKATDTPAKTPASKRQKANTVQDTKMMEPSSPMSDDGEEVTHHKDGRKMTDEEKRKNFLERNRVAALKCRQRKKQWLANLQAKVDLYSQENDALTHTVNQLRDQLMQMKSILVQHKDCPVTVNQGISSQSFSAFLNQDSQILPYGGPVNGVSQGMTMVMPDARQGPGQGQVMPRV